MLQRDYLMRLIMLFVESIRRSWTQAKVDDDPRGAADTLENMIGEATDIDGAILLSLAPESIAGVMQVSGVDPKVTEYIVRSLVLAADYLAEAGEDGLSSLRLDQARAIADAYGIDMPTAEEAYASAVDDSTTESIR